MKGLESCLIIPHGCRRLVGRLYARLCVMFGVKVTGLFYALPVVMSLCLFNAYIYIKYLSFIELRKYKKVLQFLTYKANDQIFKDI